MTFEVETPEDYQTNESVIAEIPDKILLEIFQYLRHTDLCKLATVCKKWRHLAYDSKLWQRLSIRPDYNGLQFSNQEDLIRLIQDRSGSSLRYLELSADLITPQVLHELANKCNNLKYLTLDFSNAMQLHDYNDMNDFPCNLRSLTICLSEVIFMEGFMRKVYQHLSSIEVLHLIGTFELGDEEQEENFEVINIAKIKSQTPNLKVINLYGVSFVEDSHVEMLSSNCIHLHALALNFCLRVKGSSFKVLIQRCKKLKTLLLQHCGLEDQNMMAVEWNTAGLEELDLSSTELSRECLEHILTTMPPLKYLALSHCEFFDDTVMEAMLSERKLDNIKAIDLSFTTNLSEPIISRFIKLKGKGLHGLALIGKPKLTEQFFLNIIPCLPNIRLLVSGVANGWFLKLGTKIHIDQIIIALSQNCSKLERYEAQWDPETLRTSDNSSKFIDQLRIKCPQLRCVTLSDGEYFEMVKSNFERAGRNTVVRTITNYTTSLVSLLSAYKDLLFN